MAGNLQPHYDVLADGTFVYYSDTIPSVVGGIIGRLGDKCLFTSMNNSALGNPVGWVCTVGGNNGATGTWVPFGITQSYVTAAGNNNAITVSLPGVPLTAGMQLFVFLAGLTLTNGANTISYNGGNNNNIKSHLNHANNLATSYAANSIVPLMFDGNNFVDLSQ